MNTIAKEITEAIKETLKEMNIDEGEFFTRLLDNFTKYKEYEQAVEDEIVEKARDVQEETKDYNNTDEFLEA
jgi:ribose 5-phosphate isomerase RpiB